MEVKQIGMYLIIAGAVILALKFINAIISFILSDFLLGLGTLLLLQAWPCWPRNLLKKTGMM